jgi:voltage-gated potassium channel Kch
VNKPSLAERFRYWFDGYMSKGTIALVGLLALATFVFVLVIGAIVSAVPVLFPADDDNFSFGEALWASLMRTLDPGTMGGDVGPGFRAAMLIVTLGGLIVVASLIGIISGAFDAKVEELRKGRSRVLEKDHTLILGWSTKVFPIINELVIANESRGKSAIVVLAEGDKVEMEDEIRARIPRTGKTKIIVRSGDPMDLNDLELANPHTARSIILLAPEDDPDADTIVVKTALALTNNPHRGDRKLHIVGELQEPTFLEAATLVGRDEVHWVLASEVISRITAQTCRQSGLSVVYQELLDFDGDEIYFSEQPSLVGSTYLEAQFSFAESAVIGVVAQRGVLINPAADTVIEQGDRLILIARDDDAVTLSPRGTPDAAAITDTPLPAPKPERTLVLGYNSSLHAMLNELAEYVPAGSSTTVIADVDVPAIAPYPTMSVTVEKRDSTSRAVLDSLRVTEFDHIIVLAYREHLDTQQADAKTLFTLLQLRDIEDRSGADLNIVSEMLDDRNRELAEVTKADDFIVSDKLISLMLSQVSENQQLTDVFDVLFQAEGSEIYLRPAEYYVQAGAEVSFYTVLEAAAHKGETAIGYRIAAEARRADVAYGVRVNPVKSEPITFAPGDKVIVLAED